MIRFKGETKPNPAWVGAYQELLKTFQGKIQ